MVKKKIVKFNHEFKKTLATALVAAFGFITALAWKDAINEYFLNKLSSLSILQGKLITALIITLISVIVIMITSKLTSEK